MIRKNKHGFTLMELLAVIVVLAVISLITVPLVLNMVDDSKKDAFKLSVINASKGVEYYLRDNEIDEIPDNGILVNKLSVNGTLTDGKFIQVNDKLTAEYVTDGKYCAYGTIDDLKIEKNCSDLDKTEPIIDESKLIISSTSNKITITLLEGFAIDPESDIKKYIIELYDNDKLEEKLESNDIGEFEFIKLKQNYKYDIKITVINDKNLENYYEKNEVATKAINKPTYNITPSGWAQSKKVEIIYDGIYTNEYSLDGGKTWNPYTGLIIFTENGNIIAQSHDGTNYVEGSSQGITGIDGSAPTKSTFSYTRTSNSITVIASGEDSESGVYGYRFSNDGGVTWTDIQTNNNTYTFENLTTGSYNIRVRTINNTYKNDGENEKSYLDSEIQSVSTVEIAKPTYKITPEGWAKSKTVEITYPQGYTNEYSVDAGKTWKSYTGAIKFTENGTVIGRAHDGTNYVEGSSYTVGQIDNEGPTCTWSGESEDWRKSATITATCDDNDGSGCSEESKSWEYSTGESITTATLSYTFKDVLGNSKECKKTVNVYVDPVTPTVGISATKAGTSTTVASNTWSDKGLDFTLTAGTTGSSGYKIYYCKDTENKCTPTTEVTSGTKITSYASASGTYYIRYYIKSGAGKSSAVASYTAKIDTTAPTVSVSAVKTGTSTLVASNAWSDKGLNFTLTKGTTGSSGYTIYYCKDTENKCTPTTTATNASSITSYNTTTGTYYIRYYIKSGAGKSSAVASYTAKVDTTSPTVSIAATKTGTSTAVATNAWSNKGLDFKLTAGTPTAASGYTIYYCKDTANTCTPTTAATSGTKITSYASTTGTYYIRYYIKTGAGKSSSTASYTAKIDTAAPSVPTSTIRYGSSTGTVRTNANSWSNQNLWWGNFNSTDTGGSNLDRYEYSTSCTKTVNGTLAVSEYSYGNGTNAYYCIRAVDKAGNASAWSSAYYFKVDTSAPSVPTSTIRYGSSTGSVRTNANSWSNQNLWWGNFNSTDTGGSNLDRYEYSTSCTKTVNGTLAVSEYSYGNGTNAYYCIRAVDKAGNASAWSSAYYFKVDTAAPGCTWSGESKDWRKSATITATCSDTGGSKCTETSKSWGYTSGEATTKTATLSYTFKDGAGNSHICSRNVDVYVDRTKPTCTWDGESTSWRSSATIKATCSDYIDGVSGSGCAATTAGTSWLFASTLVKTSDLSYNITDVVGNAATCTKTANVYVGQVPTNLKVIKHTQTSYCSGGVKYEGTNVEKPTNSSNAVIVQIAATNATYYQICTSATAGCVTINKVTGNCASWGGTGASTVGQASYEDNLGYRWARACNDVGCTGTTRFYVK